MLLISSLSRSRRPLKSPRAEKQTHQFSELNVDFLNESRLKSQDTIKRPLVTNAGQVSDVSPDLVSASRETVNVQTTSPKPAPPSLKVKTHPEMRGSLESNSYSVKSEKVKIKHYMNNVLLYTSHL